jgi:hypothetical protein
MVRRLQLCRVVAILVILIFTVSALVALIVVPSPARAASLTPSADTFFDNFTKDTVLNPGLWVINGSVGQTFGEDQCAGLCTNITLAPTFSSSLGMEIDQINAKFEVGTIGSVANYTPPFTANATVEGTVSNGHTFVFAITTQNASAGLQITGDVNSTNCSNLGNCGDPSVCGNSVNGTPPNQCYYGIDAKAGTGGGDWKSQGKLYLTPSAGVFYNLSIAVSASGNAQYSVLQGRQVLATATVTVGTGPFYFIIAQSEGAPVEKSKTNTAYWMSVSLSPYYAPPPGSSTSSSSSPSSSSFWIIIAVVVAIVLILLVVATRRRRRGFTVRVLDAGTLTPVSGAGVSAAGPESLSGNTGNDGRIAFGSVKDGDYSVNATATGYNPSIPVTVSVQKATDHTVRLDRIAPSETQNRPAPPPGMGATPPVQPGWAPAMAQPESAPSPTGQPELEGLEGWGGERIRHIIDTFRMKGAISPETALTAEELGLSRLFVRIMKRRRGRTRVFVEINGRYYLDERALKGSK